MDRFRIFQLCVFLLAAIIILRLFYWQFVAKIEGNFGADVSSDTLPATRGEIYTADNFPIVTNQNASLLYAHPREIDKDPKDLARILAPFLISEKYSTREARLSADEKQQKEEEIKTKEESLTAKLANKNFFWIQLARKVPRQTRYKIEDTKINGLGFERDDKRFYPEASLAAHVIGFVGSDKFGEDTGYFGLEGYYDHRLRGKPGKSGKIIDPFGFPILIGKFRPHQPQKGTSLHLTIDRSIQFMVEEKLRLAIEKYDAKGGTIIISDPKNGHILAMANSPTYQPALYSEYNENLYKNPAVAETYEPGSTFKLIAMSAALDLGLVDPQTRCEDCSGARQIGGFEISTWNKKYYPNSTMTEIIQHSDNVGMTYVAAKLQVDKFYDYISKFGFGKETGIDLQGESTGFVRAKKDWKPIDLATASFGQGIAVTPIQMVQAVATIANHGKLITPKVVARIEDGKKTEEVKPNQIRQVISPQAATLMTEMMVNAVQNGEAKAFAPKGFRIAGKTGTAQIPVAGHYDPNKTITSFVGFVPADDPRFVMLVRFTEPTSSPFGSETAAPTFFEVAKELFNYFGILPSKN
ncbi:penicillin-binding protein 2 [Candidatus Curtissbacteria bacterium]|nr:penicillin-binding protein 2 [Candidatus Curtissbacteria bacterium]